jgi:predicted nucleic acid-binding Zn ribbon protein
MEKLGSVIEGIVRDLTAKKSGKNEFSPECWLKKTLTKKELGHIKFHYFRKGVLGVRVDSSAWLYSLSLKKDTLLKMLKRVSPEVQELRFSIGEIK